MDFDELFDETRKRVANCQCDIPSYYDGRVLNRVHECDPAWAETMARHLRERGRGRFVSWEDRRATAADGLDNKRRSEIPDAVIVMSQGTANVLRWQERELFKSVFDFAVVPMLLAELQPASILEFGSGNGASALWMADIAELNRFPCRIVSIDKTPVSASRPHVTFVNADVRNLDKALLTDALAAGPRLVVEDAHVAVDDVMHQVDQFLETGDYLLVEDSVGKSNEIAGFLAQRPGDYAVDTRYTDFFGRNATSCVDSIFRKMQ